jgi:DNA polymerase sigma
MLPWFSVQLLERRKKSSMILSCSHGFLHNCSREIKIEKKKKKLPLVNSSPPSFNSHLVGEESDASSSAGQDAKKVKGVANGDAETTRLSSNSSKEGNHIASSESMSSLESDEASTPKSSAPSVSVVCEVSAHELAYVEFRHDLLVDQYLKK